MKIIQTFWTAGQDPLKHGFGWAHPEYNLMSWALSCLSLREHYDEVELYTDSAGYHILIKVLQLPYTKTHVIFDDFQCLPHHWALSKIKTYSLQTEPFLHIDGDIYLPRPLPERVLNAPLVAQNREIGTGYYKNMMNRILEFPDIHLPNYIVNGLSEESIASYNMGIFGGNNTLFINDYCREVFSFMDENSMNDKEHERSHVDCNVFFEQVIFAVYSDLHHKFVYSVLGKPMIDEGYMGKDFCALKDYEEKQFFHILGGHKRNKGINNMLERTLIRLYPSYYKRIANVFPDRHNEWINSEEAEEMFMTERLISSAFKFIDVPPKEQERFVIKNNPFVKKVYYSRNKLFLRRTRTNHILEDVPIGKLAENIIAILSEEELLYSELKKRTKKTFARKLKKRFDKIIENEMTYLLYYGVITAECITN